MFLSQGLRMRVGYVIAHMKSFTSWTQQDKGHALADQIAPMTTVTMATTTFSMKYLIRAYRLEKAHIQTRSVGTTKSRQGNGAVGTVKPDTH